MTDPETDGRREPEAWLLETLRAVQGVVNADPASAGFGERVCGSLVGPAENAAAWIGRPHEREGYVDVVASSDGLPEAIEPDGDGPSATSRAIDEGEVLIRDAAEDAEYRALNAAGELPAAEKAVSIPLGGAESVGVLHLYTVDDSPARAGTAAVSDIGDAVSVRFRLRETSDQLEHERERLEALRSLVSHDLGNPLNLAAGRLDLARTEVESEHLGHVETGLQRIDALADTGVKFVKVGRKVEDREPVELDEIAPECWKYSGDERGELEVAATTVRGESERLRMLLNELFENAVVHNDGPVTVTVGPLDRGGFYVADDGEGIPEDDREHVFDRGYTTDEERDGHGLAVVEEIARAHGWRVGLETAETGTRIEVETARW
jgi:signal transduction histidine kinase